MHLTSLIRLSALAGLVAFSSTAHAQETSDLPVGQPTLGTTYTAETHGDWEIRCIRVEEGQPEPCQLYQLMSDDAGNPVAEINVFDLPDDGPVVAGATIVTPLDTLLPPGIRMRVDSGEWVEYPFAFCQEIGCFARLGLTEGDLAALRAGGDAFVALVPLPAPDQIVELTASLSGFTAGFEALTDRMEAAQSLVTE